jgi:hypothetical protein
MKIYLSSQPHRAIRTLKPTGRIVNRLFNKKKFLSNVHNLKDILILPDEESNSV